jgi:hypothetical protein
MRARDVHGVIAAHYARGEKTAPGARVNYA